MARNFIDMHVRTPALDFSDSFTFYFVLFFTALMSVQTKSQLFKSITWSCHLSMFQHHVPAPHPPFMNILYPSCA